jgi:hypothetical protein
MTMTLIETKTLGTAAASIEFTSIPQTFTDLVVLVSARGASTSDFPSLLLRFNSNSASYSARFVIGSGTGTSSSTGGTTSISIATMPGSAQTANTFGNSICYVPNYTAAVNKSVSIDSVSETNSAAAFSRLVAGLWSNTAAITSLAIIGDSVNLEINSTVSLYGILKGSDGIVTTS